MHVLWVTPPVSTSWTYEAVIFILLQCPAFSISVEMWFYNHWIFWKALNDVRLLCLFLVENGDESSSDESTPSPATEGRWTQTRRFVIFRFYFEQPRLHFGQQHQHHLCVTVHRCCFSTLASDLMKLCGESRPRNKVQEEKGCYLNQESFVW